jgi:trimethylamine--corrinoid protein Co-methyltransferase
MGVDLIKEVGIGGHFLAQPHTLEHMRAEQVQSNLIDRRIRDEWEAQGAKSLIQSAHEKAADLIDTHQPSRLPQGMVEELKRIVKSAEE